MRCVESRLRGSALVAPVALAALLAACASTRPAPSLAVPNATPTSVAAASAAPPIDAALQAEFDAAVKALREERNDDATRRLRALAAAHPELAGAHANLGLVERRAGRLAESAQELEIATQLSPRQPSYLNELGVSYRRLGRFADARAAYERALAVDPAYAPALLNLAILQDLYLWDGAAALPLYERYVAATGGGDANVDRWVAEVRQRMQRELAAKGAR